MYAKTRQAREYLGKWEFLRLRGGMNKLGKNEYF